ncbi:MAG: restriction endonuclease subunit S [Chromatiaceae bacterium]|nr:restriction endonuclease subunit S [Chromatiaceae bacterium]
MIMSYDISRYEVEKLDAYASIQPGFAFKSERFTDNLDDIPLVKGENVHQGYIDWPRAKHWPLDEYDSLSRYHLVAGDIVLAMDRPWVTAGLKWSYIKLHDPKSLLVQRVARIRAKGKLDQDYLRHIISSDYFANYLQPIVTGINVPHISGKQIGDFRIPIPDLGVQRKIAAILSAYDDLIETNKRRIALLEGMAEEIYREWFVRMRFPGHKKTKFVKGVPEGWEIKRLGDILQLAYGKALTESDREPGEFPVYGSGGIIGSHSRPFVKGKGIVVGRKGNVGAVYFSDRGFFPIDTVFYVISALPLSFQFFLLRTMNFINNDAAVPGLNRNQAYANQLFYPGDKLIENFAQVADPIFLMKHQLVQQNSTLIKTRNLLLPRLISGKLSVADLDIQFPPSMREEIKGVDQKEQELRVEPQPPATSQEASKP